MAQRTTKSAQPPVVIEHTTDLVPLTAQAGEYLKASVADNTVRAYKSDWAQFTAWCESHGLDRLPAAPGTVCLYLTDMAANHKPSTIERRLSAISEAHKHAGYPPPTKQPEVRKVLKGIRRTLGIAQSKKAPVRAEHLREIAPQLTDSLQGLRDRALLLVGYSGGFRRSELTGLDVSDLAFSVEGLAITVRHSKTDQEGRGHVKELGYCARQVICPIRSLQEWLERAGISSGPVFRPIDKGERVKPTRLSDKSVSLIIKRLAPAFGADPAEVGGHSLRAGFVTDHYRRGTPEAVIMQQTGHKSPTVMAGYRRESRRFTFNYSTTLE
jgi:integrase